MSLASYRVGGYSSWMSHATKKKQQLIARVNRIIGQMNALKSTIENAEDESDCGKVLQQLASIRGALNGLLMLFLKDHLRLHVARGRSVKDRDQAADELLDALKSYKN